MEVLVSTSVLRLHAGPKQIIWQLFRFGASRLEAIARLRVSLNDTCKDNCGICNVPTDSSRQLNNFTYYTEPR